MLPFARFYDVDRWYVQGSVGLQGRPIIVRVTHVNEGAAPAPQETCLRRTLSTTDG
jgi:hypothetical protein